MLRYEIVYLADDDHLYLCKVRTACGVCVYGFVVLGFFSVVRLPCTMDYV